MSAEWAPTVLSCDMRTAPDGRSGEYAESFTMHPRWLREDGTINRDTEEPTWAACIAYAELAVKLAARAIREQPMEGLTGDHPEKREEVAAQLEHIAKRVRLLALDHACDGVLTEEEWAESREWLVSDHGDR